MTAQIREAMCARRVKGDRVCDIARDFGVSEVSVRAYTRGVGHSDAQVLLRSARLKSDTGCWVWHGTLLRPNGAKGNCYPQVGSPVLGERYARRASYRLWVGELPKGYGVLPICGEPLCVNPFHLRAQPPQEYKRLSPHWDPERNQWRFANGQQGNRSPERKRR